MPPETSSHSPVPQSLCSNESQNPQHEPSNWFTTIAAKPSLSSPEIQNHIFSESPCCISAKLVSYTRIPNSSLCQSIPIALHPQYPLQITLTVQCPRINWPLITTEVEKLPVLCKCKDRPPSARFRPRGLSHFGSGLSVVAPPWQSRGKREKEPGYV